MCILGKVTWQQTWSHMLSCYYIIVGTVEQKQILCHISLHVLTVRAHAWQGMTEKGIDQLRADLAAVDADCADQIRKTVHDNYHHFIQACQVCHPAYMLPAAHKP